MSDNAMIESALRLTRDAIKVRAGEEVLVITDPAKLPVAKALAKACQKLEAVCVTAVIPASGLHGNEPPRSVAAAMKAAEVVFTATTNALTHTRARLDAAQAGARVAILRGVDEDMMTQGAMTVDFASLKESNSRLRQILTQGEQVRVTSSLGTEVSFSLAGRTAFSLDGYFHEDTGFAVLPPGEVPTCPVEGTTNGTIVIDYSMDGLGVLSQPLRFEVSEGKVTSVTGGPPEVEFLEKLFAQDASSRNIAEFAIGTNPKARLTGNLAEDKKKLGTVHFAIGDNRSLGGVTESSIHLDGLIQEPTVEVDGATIVKQGVLVSIA